MKLTKINTIEDYAEENSRLEEDANYYARPPYLQPVKLATTNALKLKKINTIEDTMGTIMKDR